MILRFLGCFLWGALSFASPKETISKLARHMANPGELLGELETLGSSSREGARIILLPEVHNDAQSLVSQFLILSEEKKKAQKLIFLGESIPAYEKSPWDLFSQRAINIATALEFKGRYSPERFEKKLINITKKLKSEPGEFARELSGLWTLLDFINYAEPLFGWDRKEASLFGRNTQLVETLKNLSNNSNYERIIILLGARHVPELEYLSSLKLLCPGHGIKDMEHYFALLKNLYGAEPKLPHGIGATMPLYEYLINNKYAILFDKNLYKKISQAMHKTNKTRPCIDINKRPGAK